MDDTNSGTQYICKYYSTLFDCVTLFAVVVYQSSYSASVVWLLSKEAAARVLIARLNWDGGLHAEKFSFSIISSECLSSIRSMPYRFDYINAFQKSKCRRN